MFLNCHEGGKKYQLESIILSQTTDFLKITRIEDHREIDLFQGKEKVTASRRENWQGRAGLRAHASMALKPSTVICVQ